MNDRVVLTVNGRPVGSVGLGAVGLWLELLARVGVVEVLDGRGEVIDPKLMDRREVVDR